MKGQAERHVQMEAVCDACYQIAGVTLPELTGVLYDTDESGRLEWVHATYRGGAVRHMEVTGLTPQAARSRILRELL